jgi:hypothetical protein
MLLNKFLINPAVKLLGKSFLCCRTINIRLTLLHYKKKGVVHKQIEVILEESFNDLSQNFMENTVKKIARFIY